MTTNQRALGINLRKMKPYNVMVILDSVSEKKRLQQYFKAAEFNPVDLDDENIAYVINRITENPTVEDLMEKFYDDESRKENRMENFLDALKEIDILCIEFRLTVSSSEIVQRIQAKFPKMIVILTVHYIRKDLVEEIAKTKANAYLTKPISKDTLYEKLKAILNRRDLVTKEIIGYVSKGINLNDIQIPPLSQVLSQVMMFDTDRAKGSEELEQIVSPDKSLSADLMRIANSAFYGRTGSIRTLSEAITLIGLKTINNIAVVKARRIFTQKLQQPIFQKYLDEFPILTGLIALDLSTPLHLNHLNNQIFINSILYKIGMTILALNQTQRYANLLQTFEQKPKSILQLEKEEFNTDYIHLGIKIFKTWQLPSSMQEIVKNQEFTQSQISLGSDLDRLLRIASIFALKLLGTASEEDIQIAKGILKYYYQKEDIIRLFNDEYYLHIKSHPFFEVF